MFFHLLHPSKWYRVFSKSASSLTHLPKGRPPQRGVARLLPTTWTTTPYPPWNSHFLTLKMDVVGISRSFPKRIVSGLFGSFAIGSYVSFRECYIQRTGIYDLKKVPALSFPKWPVRGWIPNPLNISVFGVPIVFRRSVVLRQIGCFGFFQNLKRWCLGKIDLSLNG